MFFDGAAIRYRTLGTSALGLLLGLGVSQAEAAPWKPERPVELIVPSAPGGSFDKTARLIEKFARDGGLVTVPITVVNRAGGGGNLALAYLQQRPKDGHSLMITSTALLANHIVGRSEHTYRDLTPVVTLFSEYISTIVLPSSPFAEPKAFARQLQKDPAAITFGFCCAMGGGNHLAAAMLVKAVGGDVKKMKNVVFKGAGNVTTAVLGGHIVAASNPASNVLGPLLEGKLRVVAVSAPERIGGALKDVPTWKEQGFDVVMGLWRNLIGPSGMPPEHLRYWEQTLHKLTRSKAWQAELERNMWKDTFKDSAETKQYLDGQYRTLSELLSDVGLAKN